MKAQGALHWKPRQVGKGEILELTMLVPRNPTLAAALAQHPLGTVFELQIGPAQQAAMDFDGRDDVQTGEGDADRTPAWACGVAAWGRDRKRKHAIEECPYDAGTFEASQWQDGYDSAQTAQGAADMQGEASFIEWKDGNGKGATCQADGCRKRKLAPCPKCGGLRCEEHYSDHLVNAHPATVR